MHIFVVRDQKVAITSTFSGALAKSIDAALDIAGVTCSGGRDLWQQQRQRQQQRRRWQQQQQQCWKESQLKEDSRMSQTAGTSTTSFLSGYDTLNRRAGGGGGGTAHVASCHVRENCRGA